MSDPFIGEIRIVSFKFAPQGWAACDGQILQVIQNQALFALIGNTYGGNGQTNFALPDFRGRVPIHFGAGFSLGGHAGEEAHQLSVDEVPAHTHTVSANDTEPNAPYPANDAWAAVTGAYAAAPDNSTIMHPTALGTMGGSQAHPNCQPSLVLNFIIALWGLFPSRN